MWKVNWVRGSVFEVILPKERVQQEAVAQPDRNKTGSECYALKQVKEGLCLAERGLYKWIYSQECFPLMP